MTLPLPPALQNFQVFGLPTTPSRPDPTEQTLSEPVSSSTTGDLQQQAVTDLQKQVEIVAKTMKGTEVKLLVHVTIGLGKAHRHSLDQLGADTVTVLKHLASQIALVSAGGVDPNAVLDLLRDPLLCAVDISNGVPLRRALEKQFGKGATPTLALHPAVSVRLRVAFNLETDEVVALQIVLEKLPRIPRTRLDSVRDGLDLVDLLFITGYMPLERERSEDPDSFIHCLERESRIAPRNLSRSSSLEHALFLFTHPEQLVIDCTPLEKLDPFHSVKSMSAPTTDPLSRGRPPADSIIPSETPVQMATTIATTNSRPTRSPVGARSPPRPQQPSDSIRLSRRPIENALQLDNSALSPSSANTAGASRNAPAAQVLSVAQTPRPSEQSRSIPMPNATAAAAGSRSYSTLSLQDEQPNDPSQSRSLVISREQRPFKTPTAQARSLTQAVPLLPAVPPTPPFLQQQQDEAMSPQTPPERYPRRNRGPTDGRMYIFNWMNFGGRAAPRIGSQYDVIAMRSLAQHLRFPNLVYRDRNRQDFLRTLDCIVRPSRPFARVGAVLCLVLMSHGDREGIMCSDGKFVSFREIRRSLSASALRGVPKLVIVVACRCAPNTVPRALSRAVVEATDADCSRDEEPDEFDALCAALSQANSSATEPPPPTGGQTCQSTQISDSPTGQRFELMLEEGSDIVWATPTIEDYASLLTEKGSPYIEALCGVFRERAALDDVITMLTHVNEKVSSVSFADQALYMQPEIKSTLRGPLYLARASDD